MNLEAAISELNKSILTLIETTKASDALRTELLEKSTAIAKPAAAAKDEAKKAEADAAAAEKAEKAEKAAAAKAEAERQITKSPEDRKEDEAAPEIAPEVETAMADVAAFVKAADSAEDREKRKSDVRTLLDKLSAARTSDLSATDAVRLSGAIAKLVVRYAPAPKTDDDLL